MEELHATDYVRFVERVRNEIPGVLSARLSATELKSTWFTTIFPLGENTNRRYFRSTCSYAQAVRSSVRS